jgi:hypothetical protein
LLVNQSLVLAWDLETKEEWDLDLRKTVEMGTMKIGFAQN